MKKTTRSLALIMAVLAISGITACKKDKTTTNNNNNSTPTCYLSKVTQNDQLYQDFTFNSSNQVTRANLYSNNQITYYTTVEYNGSKVKTITLYRGNNMGISTQTPTYNPDNTIQKISIFDVAASTVTHDDYAYNSQGQVIKETDYDENGNFTYKTFTYDGNGNIIKTQTWQPNSGAPTDDLLSTEEYTYDDKNSDTYFIDHLADPTASKHNILTYTFKDNNDVVDNSTSYTRTYTYTSNNYPETIKETTLDNSTTTNSKNEYNCK